MLTIYCLKVITTVTQPILLDEYCGSALRGAWIEALSQRFCVNLEAQSCHVCPFLKDCPVAALVSPYLKEKEEGAGYGHEIPRPYALLPPNVFEQRKKDAPLQRKYEVGETFTFGLHLIGTSQKLFVYVLRALQEMEQAGLGHPLIEQTAAGDQKQQREDQRDRRGRFQLQAVVSYHPFSYDQVSLWQRGRTQVHKPTLGVALPDITARATAISPEHVMLDFLTPMRLRVSGQHIFRPDFQVLMMRLAQRFEQLSLQYDEETETALTQEQFGREWYQQIKAQAEQVKVSKDETKPVRLTSYSSRQQKSLSLNGFLGQAGFRGNLTALRELLIWGELIGVGQNVTKGAGFYRVIEQSV